MLRILAKKQGQDWDTLAECDPDDTLTYRLILLTAIQTYDSVLVRLPSGEEFSPDLRKPTDTLH